jgi:MOSC domain-containing protein YiiM
MIEPRLLHLYVSPGHNYFGRHGLEPKTHPTEERAEIQCEAGQGIVGDRFLGYKPDYKGQITFFSAETFAELCQRFAVRDRPPSVLRRNVIAAGLDLDDLACAEFALQGVRFLGMGECRPCHWMNGAFHPEAEAWLRGRGGLRAKILSSGPLTVGPARFERYSATQIAAAG